MLCHKKYMVTNNVSHIHIYDEKNSCNIIQIKYSNFIQIRSIEYFCCRNKNYLICKKNFDVKFF